MFHKDLLSCLFLHSLLHRNLRKHLQPRRDVACGGLRAAGEQHPHLHEMSPERLRTIPAFSVLVRVCRIHVPDHPDPRTLRGDDAVLSQRRKRVLPHHDHFHLFPRVCNPVGHPGQSDRSAHSADILADLFTGHRQYHRMDPLCRDP